MVSPKSSTDQRESSPGPNQPIIARLGTDVGRAAVPSPLGLYHRATPRPVADDDTLSDMSSIFRLRWCGWLNGDAKLWLLFV